jgi:polyphosphate kinase 2 (PPK2 family)
VKGAVWKDRCKDIRRFENYLGRNGVRIVKFFLHVSKREQKRRFLERLEVPEKNWKFSERDVREREHWASYMRAYQDAIEHTASGAAPWYVVPADHKWFTRIVVVGAIVDALASLDIGWPRISPARQLELARARRTLLRQ